MAAIQVLVLLAAMAVYLLIKKRLKTKNHWRNFLAIAAAVLVLTIGGAALPMLKKSISNHLSSNATI
ncbi:MAG: hypothetical protein EAZ14_07885 [Runella slithyformis]|nr:MAG: hypothetical protein EAZ14_07885 [Runella slithyformis]